ncbi:MAG: NAD(P)H-dependent oxidoreductase subunit E [Peptococcia bacterium]
MTCQCQCSSEKDDRFCLVDRVVERYEGQEGSLIPILHEIQEEIGYLPEDVQAYVAEKMNTTLSEVYGVVSFYALFNTEPKGKYKINVCMGTACYVKGSGQILSEFEKELGIKVGETTEDGLFTLEGCRCIGACGLAPVLTINDDVHGRLVPGSGDVSNLIKKYKVESE